MARSTVESDRLELDTEFAALAVGERCSKLLAYDGQYYATGTAMSQGYREYKTTGDYVN